ncbi:MAG: metallopeptidase TldD-related protein [Actinomycetota bacterium]|jgi:predicted Zn-dependent protease|nr:metallopeptidase TldD-related protein [Actinomycetota bacterium]
MSAQRPSHPAQVAEGVLRAARRPCVAIVEETHEAEVRFANNTATTDGVRADRRVTAIVAEPPESPGRPGRAGVARRSGEVDAGSLVAEAEAAIGPAEDAAPLVEGDVAPDFGADAPTTGLERLSSILGRLADAFAHAQRSRTVLSGYAEHRVTTTYLASSSGLRRRHVQVTGALQLVGRKDAASAWAGVGTADLADVELESLEEQVQRGLGWAARHVDVPPGRHDVVLPPSAVADLMSILVDAASGRAAEEGRTVFSKAGGGTRIGELLTPLPFHLWSDPAEPGLECAPFLCASLSTADTSVFDNGIALGHTDWVRAGKLERLRYHRAGAEGSHAAPTPPVDNLSLELPGGSGSLDDLVATVERGLLLTCLWYIREVDPKTLLLTGLTRDGVYVIEDGRVVGATSNFRFNESPLDVLARASYATSTVRSFGRETGTWMNRTAMPALRVPDWNMSSVSQAV